MLKVTNQIESAISERMMANIRRESMFGSTRLVKVLMLAIWSIDSEDGMFEIERERSIPIRKEECHGGKPDARSRFFAMVTWFTVMDPNQKSVRNKKPISSDFRDDDHHILLWGLDRGKQRTRLGTPSTFVTALARLAIYTVFGKRKLTYESDLLFVRRYR